MTDQEARKEIEFQARFLTHHFADPDERFYLDRFKDGWALWLEDDRGQWATLTATTLQELYELVVIFVDGCVRGQRFY